MRKNVKPGPTTLSSKIWNKDKSLHYLDMSQDPCRVHPTGLVDRVAPDIKDRFGGPNDPTDEGSGGHAYPQHEVVEGVFVDVVQLVVQFRCEVYQVTKVIVGIILRVEQSE